MAGLQARLLRSGAGLTAPGGRLVYATCSLFKEENQEVVEAFLTAAPGFTLEDPRPFLPLCLRPLVDSRGFLVTRPQTHGLDGFFVARMVRSPG
jgi:16S rRNA (cytosine967-C5)-methyltransferase